MDLEVLQDFLVESKELLQKAQSDTLLLETEPGNDAALASIFRAFHTIKGTSSFLQAAHLVEWTHSLENLLDKLRSHSLPVTQERIEAILKGIDVIDQMLAVMAEKQLPAAGPQQLGETIRILALKTDPISGSIAATTGNGCEAASFSNAKEILTTAGVPPNIAGTRDVDAEERDNAHTSVVAGDDESAATASPAGDEPKGRRNLPERTPATGTTGGEAAERTLRVDAKRLDAVMNQVGELVLLRNRLSSAVGGRATESEDMTRIAREMDLAVSDLQSTVMRLRMQPCRRLFQQLPRVVRDLSRQLNKDVRLEIVGEDVEIDKTVVDAFSGPLAHLVRNSLDHGIETAEGRREAKKPPTAQLRVGAFHLGDKVCIEVSDDGRGIDCRLVTQKAIEKGVITAEQAAHLSEQDALELIFRPGFSTKEKASDLSGRGVGMDVVKETTNLLRGRLAVESRIGQGTRVSTEFPLTLAVLPVIYLRVRQDVYALPISTIDSLTDLEEDRIHHLSGRVSYRVDGTRTVPLVDLGAILQHSPLGLGAERVEGVLTERGLFVVSEVLGNEDSVVKPIDFFTGKNLYQGATISGKGNVVLILDAGALSMAAPVPVAEGA